jgi:hypothetical protein
MKTTSFAVATFVALSLIGCADKSNPVLANSSTGSTSLARSVDDGSSADRVADRGGRIEGFVNAIDLSAGTVTIGSRVVQTNSLTKIERNGFHATLSQFKIGDRGQARFNAGAAIAAKVEATSN